MPSTNSSSGDNKNFNFDISISLIQDYLHLVLLSAPEGPQQWDIGSRECTSFVHSVFVQLWMEWLQKHNCHNCGHSFRECGRVVVCRLSVVSDCQCFAAWRHERVRVLLTVTRFPFSCLCNSFCLKLCEHKKLEASILKPHGDWNDSCFVVHVLWKLQNWAFRVLFTKDDDGKAARWLHSNVKSLYSVIKSIVLWGSRRRSHPSFVRSLPCPPGVRSYITGRQIEQCDLGCVTSWNLHANLQWFHIFTVICNGRLSAYFEWSLKMSHKSFILYLMTTKMRQI